MYKTVHNSAPGRNIYKEALSSLPDFVTEDGQVRDLLIAWRTSWVRDYDIDYFRVDTVKHVDDTTWKAFKNALTYIDPDFKMISSHDEDGLMYRLMNEGSRVDSDKAHALMKVAATLQITAKGQPANEAEYTSLDGITVTGWDNVIDLAFAGAKTQMASVENPSSVQQIIVNITLKSDFNMVIPEEVVAKMAASNATYVFLWENGVVTAYTASALAQIKGELDLNIMVSKDKDFGQGFRSFVLEPRKKTIYGVKLATVMLLGKENAGKTAFISIEILQHSKWNFWIAQLLMRQDMLLYHLLISQILLSYINKFMYVYCQNYKKLF